MSLICTRCSVTSVTKSALELAEAKGVQHRAKRFQSFVKPNKLGSVRGLYITLLRV